MKGALVPFHLFVVFLLGIICGNVFQPFVSVTVCGVIVGVLALVLMRKRAVWVADCFLVIFIVCVGALHASTYQARYTFGHKRSVTGPATVQVTSFPKKLPARTVCRGVVVRVGMVSVRQPVTVIDSTKEMAYLGVYTGTMTIGTRRFGKQRNVLVWVRKNTTLRQHSPTGGTRARLRVIAYLRRAFTRFLSPLGERLLTSVFLGRREVLGFEKQALTGAGVAHLLAISGLHIGLTAGVLFFVFGFCGIPFRIRLTLSVVVLWAYTILTGSSVSTVRASLMYTVFAGGFLFRRRVHPFNSLGIAGIAVLAHNPTAAFTISFQLSFLSVFALLTGFGVFQRKKEGWGIARYLLSTLVASTLVSVTLAPLVSYYFGKVYVLSVFSNLLLIPWFTLILTLTFTFLIVSPIPFLAVNLGRLLSFLIVWFVKSAQALSAIPYSSLSYRLSLRGVLFFYTALAGGWVVYRLLRRFAPRNDGGSRLRSSQ